MIDPNSVRTSHRYHLEGLLGRGGLGGVYKGAAEGISQRLAFKTVVGPDGEVPRFLLREYEILRELDHPNIVKAFDLVKIESRYYFVMEYFRGRTLC